MNDLALLAKLSGTDLRNRSRQLFSQSRFKLAVVLAFSVTFWWGLYRFFLWGMLFFRRVGAEFYFEEMMGAVFHVFFFALTLMLVFSNAIIGYSSFFKSKETAFLVASPVRPGSVFLYKFAESLAFSSWAFLFLATPLMAAYGRFYGAAPLFYLWSLFFFAAYMFIPAALGSLIAMAVTAWFPRTRKGLVVGVVLLLVAAAAVFVSKLLSVRPGTTFDMRLASEVFERVSFSQNPLFPSSWMGKGIILLREGSVDQALFFFGLIAVNAVFLTALAQAVAGGLLMKGWYASQEVRGSRRFGGRGLIDWVVPKLLAVARPETRHIVGKDLKSFVRDPVQWSQFLVFFGLLGVYFVNLRTFGYDDREIFWKNLVAQMNVLATSLTLATFSSRFIFPQLSLEGRRFWIIGMVPMPRERILYGKLTLCFMSALVISESLLALSSLMLRTPPVIVVLHAFTLLGICLGLSGLSVGMGALYPNFSEDNPSKIIAGFGGTLNLVISLAFVVSVLAIQSVPCFLYFGDSALSPAEFRNWLAVAMSAIAVISVAACLVPMRMGLRALERLEV